MTKPGSMSYPIGDGLTVRIPPGARGPEPYGAGIDNWDNEGGAPCSGSTLASAPFQTSGRHRRPRLVRPRRQPQDTAEGCRARAGADLLRSTTMDTDQGRWRLEHSAASWSARADLLHRLEMSFQRRNGEQAT